MIATSAPARVPQPSAKALAMTTEANPYVDTGTAADAEQALRYWDAEARAVQLDIERLEVLRQQTETAFGREREAMLRAAEVEIDAEIARLRSLWDREYAAQKEGLDAALAEAEAQFVAWADLAQSRALQEQPL